MTKYPAQLDDNITLPSATDNLTPVNANLFNSLRKAILSVETALGTNPQGAYSNVKSRLSTVENTVGNLNVISLSNDLGGTLSNPKVIGIQGNPITDVTPEAYTVMVWNGSVWYYEPFPSFSINATGDVNGVYPSLQVVDLTITGEQQGSVLYFNGSNWVQLAPGTDGYFLSTQSAVPVWTPSTDINGALAGGDLSGTYPNPSIGSGVVTFNKIQNITTDRLLGRDTAASGSVEEISLDTTLEFSGSLVLRRAAITGDVTISTGSNASAISSNVITNTHINTSADIEVSKLLAGNDGYVLKTLSGLPTWNNLLWTDLQGVGTDLQEPSGFPSITTSSISYDDVSRTFTIEPVSSTFEFWVMGTKYTKSSPDTVVWTDVEGLHHFIYDTSGTLIHTVDSADVLAAISGAGAYVASIYWDATNSQTIRFSEERHGLMPGATHLWAHQSLHAQWVSGGLPGNFSADGTGDDDIDGYFSISDGYLRDEDLITAWNDVKQNLSTVANIPVFYLSGSSPVWRKKEANDFPVIESGATGTGYTGASGRPAYNLNSGGTWSLSEVNNNNFFLIHIFATNDINEPIIAVLGTDQYSTISQARDAAASATEFSSLTNFLGNFAYEMITLFTVIYQVSNSYSNYIKARIRTLPDGSNYYAWFGSTVKTVVSATSSTQSFSDDAFRVFDDGDVTKQIALQLSGLTTATTRTITIPDKDITLDDNTDSRPPSGTAGGDLSGTYPNPTVSDLTIASEATGSLLYYDGYGWESLATGNDGYKLIAKGLGFNPVWEIDVNPILIYQPGGIAGGNIITSITELQTATDVIYNANRFGEIIIDGTYSSGIVDINSSINLRHVMGLKAINVDIIRFDANILNTRYFKSDNAITFETIGTSATRPFVWDNTGAAKRYVPYVENIRFYSNSTLDRELLTLNSGPVNELTVKNIYAQSDIDGLLAVSDIDDGYVAVNIYGDNSFTGKNNLLLITDIGTGSRFLNINYYGNSIPGGVQNWNNSGATYAINNLGNSGLPRRNFTYDDSNDVIAVYNFDKTGEEHGGVSALDLSFASTPLYYPGHFQDSWAFAPLSTNTATNTNSAFRITTALTIEFIMYVPAAPSLSIYLGSCAGPSETEADNVLWSLQLRTDLKLQSLHEYGTGNNDSVVAAAGVVPTGEWCHVAMTRQSNGLDVEFFINGLSVATASHANVPTGGTTADLKIGGLGSSIFDGYISSVRIYDVAKTGSDIYDSYKQALGSYPQLESIKLLPNQTTVIAAPSNSTLSGAGTAPTHIVASATRFSCWQFDPTTPQALEFNVYVPENATKILVKLFGQIDGAAAGNIILEILGRSNETTFGTVIQKTFADTDFSTSTPAYNNNYISTTISSLGLVAGQVCGFDIGRDAGDAADTATSSLFLDGLIIEFY